MPRALEPLSTPHRHVKDAEATGQAALAMAIDALVEGRDWAETLEHEEIPSPASVEDLALAALREGLHARVHVERLLGHEADPVRQAGALHIEREPEPSDLERCFEAGHPVIVATSHAGPRDDDPGPRWIVVLGRDADGELRVHDPLRGDGPDGWAVEDLGTLVSSSPRPALLELAPPTRAEA